MYRDHSGELMPIIARWASGRQRAASLLGDLAPGLVPELLGVEEDAVEVEDDRLDHVYARRR